MREKGWGEVVRTEDVLKQGKLYLVREASVSKAYETALGPKLEAWYRRSRQRIDNRYREENWFLTPSWIVVARCDPDRIEFDSYPRARIIKKQQIFEVDKRSRVYGYTEFLLRRVLLNLTEGESLEIPVPDEEQIEEFGPFYRDFIDKLV